jgi:hypothetical protein
MNLDRGIVPVDSNISGPLSRLRSNLLLINRIDIRNFKLICGLLRSDQEKRGKGACEVANHKPICEQCNHLIQF